MTLTTLATITRRFILIFGLSIILGISSFIGYRVWYAYYLANLPPIEEKPDTRFGILPVPNFPQGIISTSDFTYTLDTTTGGLPKTEKIIKVFFIPKAYATLLAGEKGDQLAQKFKIEQEPQILSDTRYVYKQDNRSLTVDLDTGNFQYKNEATPTASPTQNPNDDQFITDFKNFLKSLEVLTIQLENGASKVNFSNISLWPEDIDQRPIITAEYNKALVNAQVSESAKNIENYLSLDYIFWPVDLSSFATYPAKTSDQAFADLKKGQGNILIEPTQNQISITSVYLAYFQSKEYTPYLQPVFVFEGPGFVAIVSALSDQFIDQATENFDTPIQ